jgi:hypothetical protein
VTKLELPLL